MEKRAVDGMRVMPGDSLYRIVDASVVWVEADVYESDMSHGAGRPAGRGDARGLAGRNLSGTVQLDRADDGRGDPHREGAAGAAEPRVAG